MSHSRPPSRAGTGLFRFIANAAQVESILAENNELRRANAYCKAETEKARRALSVSYWENSRLRDKTEELEKKVRELTEGCRRDRQCLLTGREKQTQLQRSLDLREEQVKVCEKDVEELTSKYDALVDEKKTSGTSRGELKDLIVETTFSQLKKDLVQAFECGKPLPVHGRPLIT
jgi:chromosome segregation ATPase